MAPHNYVSSVAIFYTYIMCIYSGASWRKIYTIASQQHK